MNKVYPHTDIPESRDHNFKWKSEEVIAYTSCYELWVLHYDFNTKGWRTTFGEFPQFFTWMYKPEEFSQ